MRRKADPSMLRVMDAFDGKNLLYMKEQLRSRFGHMRAAEKKFSQKAKMPPMMDDTKFNTLMKLVDRCHSPWHVEALRRIVYLYNIVPTEREVVAYANAIRVDTVGKEINA